MIPMRKMNNTWTHIDRRRSVVLCGLKRNLIHVAFISRSEGRTLCALFVGDNRLLSLYLFFFFVVIFMQEQLYGWRLYVPIGILFTINLLNYMDRYTIAGMLTDIQDWYNINDAQGGLIQTMFMACDTVMCIQYPLGLLYCIFANVWFSRRSLQSQMDYDLWDFTMDLHCLCLQLGSRERFKMFWLFLILRGMVGIGEASYAIISPSVIADLYTGLSRSRMLMFFYFATPVGSGLGFIVGSEVDTLTGHWQWGVRVTSVFGIICVFLMIYFIHEPERGSAEREIGVINIELQNTGYVADLWALVKNPTYTSSTFGYTALVFGVGTLSWFMPTAIERSKACQQNLTSTGELDDNTKSNINLIFGVITCISGFAGVVIGTISSNWMANGVWIFRYIQTRRSDAIVCVRNLPCPQYFFQCVGAIIGIPTMFLGIWAIDKNLVVAYVMMFICTAGLSFNWATNVDMMLSVVIPPRRNTANALQILTSHLFGDGSGPYILGAVSDWIQGDDNSPCSQFHALSTSFYLSVAILALGAALFAVSAVTVIRDQRIFAEEMGVLKSRATTKSTVKSIGDFSREKSQLSLEFTRL